MMKKFFAFLAVLISVIAIGLWVLNAVILPKKLNTIISGFVRENTGRHITIGSANYLPPARLYLKDISLYNNESSQEPLAEADELAVNLSLWPFVKEREIIADLDLRGLTCRSVIINGVTHLALKRGPSRDTAGPPGNMAGEITFRDFSFDAPFIPNGIKDITGAVDLNDEIIRLKDILLKQNETLYTLNGEITGLVSGAPTAVVELSSDVLRSNGRFSYKEDYIKIEELKASMLDSTLEIMGDIKGSGDPSANLYCEARLDASDLREVFPDSRHIQDIFKPAGMCDAAFFLNGRLSRLKDAEASLKLKSERVSLCGLSLDNVNLDLRMKDGVINTETFSLKPYLGRMAAVLTADLNKAPLPYSLNFELKDADLARFSADASLGRQNIAGLFSSRFFLDGEIRPEGASSPADSLHGNGWIKVTEGRLWEWPLLSGIVNTLGIPGLDTVVFTEAAGNFMIGERKVSTDDFTFYSEKINLKFSGHLDYEQNIDLAMKTLIMEDMIEGSSDTTKIANLILSQAGNYAGDMRITGTLKDPKYKLSSSPIKKIFGGDAGGITDALKDIFR